MATPASIGDDIRPRVPTRGRLAEAIVVAISMVANLAGLVLGVQAAGRPGVLDVTPVGSVGAFLFVLTVVSVGVVLRARRPDHGLGWTFLAFGIIAALSATAWGIMLETGRPGGDLELGRTISWVGSVLTTPAWTYMITTLVVCFPSGVPASPADRKLLRWAILPALAMAITSGLFPGPLPVYPAFDNPIVVPLPMQSLVVAATALAYLAGLVPGALAVLSMVRRYRDASNVERHQLRWFAYGAALTMATGIVYVVVGVIVAPSQTFPREASYALFIVSACSLPIAVLIAIVRYDLYDIDRIIGRTVAYGALTAILAGLYAASVRSFNALFVLVTGQSNEAALILTTLVLATTFTPIKTRLEHLAARRFPPDPVPEGPSTDGTTVAATALAAESDLPSMSLDELDARMEAIARRVAAAVIDERASGAADR